MLPLKSPEPDLFLYWLFFSSFPFQFIMFLNHKCDTIRLVSRACNTKVSVCIRYRPWFSGYNHNWITLNSFGYNCWINWEQGKAVELDWKDDSCHHIWSGISLNMSAFSAAHVTQEQPALWWPVIKMTNMHTWWHLLTAYHTCLMMLHGYRSCSDIISIYEP